MGCLMLRYNGCPLVVTRDQLSTVQILLQLKVQMFQHQNVLLSTNSNVCLCASVRQYCTGLDVFHLVCLTVKEPTGLQDRL